MAYCTPDEVKVYLGIKSALDDELISDLIDRAEAAIETYTDRDFQASSDTTRNFTVGKDTDGPNLYFDRDICSITTVTNNADNGTGGSAIPSTSYVTMPRDDTPYFGIKLLSSKNLTWTYTSDPEAGITVAGKWGFSTTPPADVKHACVRLAAYYYRQKDAQVFDVTAVPDAGIITIPQGLPADVKVILMPYMRVAE